MLEHLSDEEFFEQVKDKKITLNKTRPNTLMRWFIPRYVYSSFYMLGETTHKCGNVINDFWPIGDRSDWDWYEEADSNYTISELEPKKCNCPIEKLMAVGCKCGGV